MMAQMLPVLASKTRNAVLLMACVIGLLGAPAYNLLADPTGIFRDDISGGYFLNSRHSKTDHLLREERYDTLLLGSSRVALMDPSVARDDLGKTYNLAFLSGRPSDYAALIPTLAARDRLAPRLMLGLDLTAFQVGSAAPFWDHHPIVTGENAVSWTLRNLFNAPGFAFFGLFAHHLNETGVPAVRWNLATGRYAYPRRDAMIRDDPETYFATATLPPPRTTPVPIDWSEVDALVATIEAVQQSGSRLCVFWHPHRPEDIARYDPLEVARLKRSLEQVVPGIIDISDVSWLDDHESWYDLHHPLPPKSREVLDRAIAGCDLLPSSPSA